MVNCNCGLEAKLVVTKKPGANLGRKFYTCSKPQGEQCNFFLWEDKADQVDTTQKYQPRKIFNLKKEPNWDEIRREKAEGLAKGAAFNKSVDVAIAAYNKGEITFDDIPSFVLKVFDKLKEINLED